MNHTAAAALLILPVLSGLLTCVSFPRIDQGYVAWFALVPLLLYLIEARTVGKAFWGGFIAGVVEFLGVLYWIPPVLTRYGGLSLPTAWGMFLLMVAVLGCYSAAACALTRLCMKGRGPCLLLVFPPAWVMMEFLRSRIPFGGFPWLLIGYSQTDYLRLIQIADIVGVYGVSFAIAWMNTALVWAWHRRSRGLTALGPIALGAVMLTVSLAYGSASLRRWDRLKPHYRAALLQENMGIDESEAELARKYKEGYISMANQLGSSKIDLLVLPESPSPLIYQYDPDYREALQRLARRYTLGIIFNNVSFRAVEGTTRYFNSAYFMDGSGNEVARYDKIHLVPFGEYVPLKRLFFFSETISKDVGDFCPGTEYVTVNLGGHEVNALICFEAVFPDLSCEFIRRGSQLIVNLTNDAWYGDTAAPYQHLEMARWRAIESRRYLLRAANSGISAVIEPSGRIQAQTGLLREDIGSGTFAFLVEKTIFVRVGSHFPILCVIITFLALLWTSAVRGRSPAIQYPGGRND